MAPPKNSLATAPLTEPLTPLQGHGLFFDRDKDGILTIPDTFWGLRAVGFTLLPSFVGAIILHGAFSFPTTKTGFPDPFLRIHVDRLHRAVHGSDSKTYSHKGDFDTDRFEDIFRDWTLPPHDSIGLFEIIYMVLGNSDICDLFGFLTAMFEWVGIWMLLWPPTGRLTKEEVKGVFDGSTFRDLAQKNSEKPPDYFFFLPCFLRLWFWLPLISYILNQFRLSFNQIVDANTFRTPEPIEMESIERPLESRDAEGYDTGEVRLGAEVRSGVPR
ncbi:hypothetical protein M422DRAFT_780512 [Sphaerobolus stellatus SS14]|uniref:Uncharacterized protein n=1 Tax=Sphaerobolus stellatus (strain SS14) TaxID=990650 RepID=A0A0C9VRV6_SPHS4|nr:hypothetical protein M422DRAFT_780512 [Sphaerobolus stellatus SS14]